ncbi:MAG: gas vesicle protein [Acidobacteriota bacterium]|nr:gas vesicle protein [Acidobacteriota bacterium]
MKRPTPLPSSPLRRTTVSPGKPPKRGKMPPPPRVKLAPPRSSRPPAKNLPPRREVAHIIDESEKSLVDVLDSLLNQGVVLNADLILALADVDLVYVRLSALLCAADRVLPSKTS